NDAGKTEAVQKFLEARLQAPVLALIGRRPFAPGRACRGAQQQTVLQSFCRRELRFLFDEPKPQALASLQFAVIEPRLTCEHTKQGRLTGAVAADQPESLAGPYGELRFVKERPLAEGDPRIEQCDQGHRRIVRIRPAIRAPTTSAAPRRNDRVREGRVAVIWRLREPSPLPEITPCLPHYHLVPRGC